MKMGLTGAVGVMLSVALLSGCAVQKMDREKLLSPAEATATFKALGYGEWVESPFVRTEALCGAEKFPVQFSEIKHAIYSLRKSSLLVGGNRKGSCSAVYTFVLKDIDDANRLVKAANSLGANVEYMITSDD